MIHLAVRGHERRPPWRKAVCFTLGSTGILMRLDPLTGAIVWQHDLTSVAGRAAPTFGFSSSPLVVGPLVIVYAGGPGDKGVLAFAVDTGELSWSTAAGANSYSSPQLSQTGGEDLVLMLTDEGLLFLDPVTGKQRLNYSWPFSNNRTLQPHDAGDGVFLLATGMNVGTRAIRITKANGNLVPEDLWTAKKQDPDFTDFVSYQGHTYGVVGGILTCLDLKTGERKWKGGRYGRGQVILLEKSGLLLVSSEEGQSGADSGESSRAQRSGVLPSTAREDVESSGGRG